VFFYNNTFAFKPGATEELDQLVDFLNFNPTVEVEIQGHTANDTEDIRPDPNFKGQGKEWNFKGSALKLSERRAEAVMTYLIDKGVSKKRLVAKGYGDSQKRIPDAKTFEEFEKNMRVEAVVTKQ
jgi:outer membrane protein OmpA-like peptidoglycan-associated protein